MMTGDVSQVNFSSARIRRLDYKREAEREQWLHVIPRLIAPMVRAFVDAAELGGLVKKPITTCAMPLQMGVHQPA
jgi:capsid protein